MTTQRGNLELYGWPEPETPSYNDEFEAFKAWLVENDSTFSGIPDFDLMQLFKPQNDYYKYWEYLGKPYFTPTPTAPGALGDISQYASGLMDYLRYNIDQGRLTPEDANQIIEDEERRLNKGEALNKLPNYSYVQDFLKRQEAVITQQQKAQTQLQQAQLDREDWVKAIQSGKLFGNAALAFPQFTGEDMPPVESLTPYGEKVLRRQQEEKVRRLAEQQYTGRESRANEGQARIVAENQRQAKLAATMPGIDLGKMGLSENLERYAGSQAPGLVTEWQRTHPGEREAWWERASRPANELAPNPLLPRRAELQQQAISAGGSQNVSGAARRELGDIYTELETQRGYQPAALPKDPLEEYLKKYPWLEKYMELSPGARGESPSRYRPPVRFYR